MSRMICPYCNSKDSLKINYSNKGTNKRKGTTSNIGIKEGTIKRDRQKLYKKYDFDGKRITGRLNDRYCECCEREFLAPGKMAVIDIENLNFIIGTSNVRYRVILDFSNKDEIVYSVIRDFIILTKNKKLNRKDSTSILISIKESRINIKSKDYGNSNIFDKYYWILKFEYMNGTSSYINGNDIFPDNWDMFKNALKKILPNDLYKLC